MGRPLLYAALRRPHETIGLDRESVHRVLLRDDIGSLLNETGRRHGGRAHIVFVRRGYLGVRSVSLEQPRNEPAR